MTTISITRSAVPVRLLQPALALVLILGFGAGAAHSQTAEDVWSAYAASPNSHPNIPNNSYAGYRRGDVPIPDVPVVVRAADYGVVADGTTDNTGALRAAIDAAWRMGGGAVLLPPGVVLARGVVHLSRSGVVLRGAGLETTTLRFDRSLAAAIAPDLTGSGGSRWSWQGGMLWVSPPEQLDTVNRKVIETFGGTDYGGDWSAWWSGSTAWSGPRLADVTNTPTRGSFTVEVNDASQLRAGQHYLLCWRNKGAADSYALWKHLAGHSLMGNFNWGGAGALNDRAQWQWPVEIRAIAGNTITLAQPLRADVRAGFEVGFEPTGPVVEEIGIEDLTIEMVGAPLTKPHNTYDGWNAVFFTKTINCWVRRVRIANAENGVLSRSNKGLALSGIEFTGTVRMHHAQTFVRGTDCLLEDFLLDAPVHHGISVEDLSSGIVCRHGVMNHGTFDSHRFMPFDIVRTDISLFNDGGPGGANDFGPFVGKNVVHWNVEITGGGQLANGGLYVNQPDAHSLGALVGVRGAPTDTSDAWAMVPGEKGNIIADPGAEPGIPDLYAAQLQFRHTGSAAVDLVSPNGGYAMPGAVTLEAAGFVSAGRSIASVTFQLDGTPQPAVTVAPYRLTWAGAPGGVHEVRVKMVDDLGAETWSAPRRLVLRHQLVLQENHPNVLYTGSWSTLTDASHFGRDLRETSGGGSAEVDFHGTRAVVYGFSNNNAQNIAIYLDDMGTPQQTIHVQSGSPLHQSRIWDSGELPDGPHHLRISGVSGSNRARLDFLEITSTGPAPTPLDPTARVIVSPPGGPAPLTAIFDATPSRDADGIPILHSWNFGDGSVGAGAVTNHTFAQAGTYQMQLTVTDSDLRLRILARQVHVGPASAAPHTFVSWGNTGGLVTTHRNLRDADPAAQLVDLDGDGTADDSVAQHTFSTSSPLNPTTGYSGMPFYGGWRVETLNPPTRKFDRARVENSSSGNDSLKISLVANGAGQSGRLIGLLYFDKADFLAGGATQRVKFTGSSILRMSGVTLTSAGEVRWLVREGTQFFVSQDLITPSSGTATLAFHTDGTDGYWAPYDPATSLDFDQQSAIFLPRDFADVTAVGLMAGSDARTSSRPVVQFSGFEATGLASTSPYEAWLSAHFSPAILADPAKEATHWGESADLDSDRQTTLSEYFQGSNPSVADGNDTTELERNGTNLQFRYLRLKTAVDVSGAVKWSDDLVNWSSAGVTEQQIADLGDTVRMEATIPSDGAPRRFVRLKITR